MSKSEVWSRILAPVDDENRQHSTRSHTSPKPKVSKGQQGPGRRSTIANIDHPFCLYVLHPPNCTTSQFVAIRNSSKPPIYLALRI
jgi:hypothetical protein